MRILAIVGARPNLIKMASLVCAMRRLAQVEPVLIHTGQHYDENMSGVFFRELGIPEPDYNLDIGSGTHAWQTAHIMLALEPLFANLSPSLVLVVGDVNSTLAAALVASKMMIPLAHVEAGLRSRDRTMPEEINRIVTDSLSDFLFTTEESANQNLRSEGIPDDRVFYVGNVMIDTLMRHREHARTLGMPSRYDVLKGKYAVLTLHRPSNVDVPDTLRAIVSAIDCLQQYLPVVFPAHPRTKKRLGEMGLVESVLCMRNVKMVEPLGYLEFLGLMADSSLVLTDSGGIQEETTILGVPCLTLRENTERPATVEKGTNQLVGTSPDRILSAAAKILNGKWDGKRAPEFWDGCAADRIVSILVARSGCAHNE